MSAIHRRLSRGVVGAVAVGLVALALVGCDEPEIEVYRIPKAASDGPPPPAATSATPPASSLGETTPATPDLHDHDHGPIWTLPPGWREVEDEQPMRLATFLAPDESGPVEVAVTRFGGDVGGVLANINRWRQQVMLPPVREADLDGLIDRFEHAGYQGYAVHLRGETRHMLAAGIYEQSHDRTWFVRVVASPEVAQRLADEVFAFARSFGRDVIDPHAPAPGADQPDAYAPAPDAAAPDPAVYEP